ncbi:FAD-dependent oxidoreductase [Edaphobacter aggregans]|uniref:FAD-dependent oxidoreductase n=1 Tax=Edaphobacter aggregans TaxID=570835 RepID=UPI0005559FA5|nr:FAD-dependent oxidoreductase [Edaphobacter aggregans]
MDRRFFLHGSAALIGSSALGLTGCARKAATVSNAGVIAPQLPFYDALGPIPPIRAHVDRIFRITVCLRPFRAAGPRMDVERAGERVIVHNYGHGGSGWSLSWGSADVAVRKALEAANGGSEIAVVGCGALGLTAAITAQRTGLRVTIYAKERPPYVRSARATGSWTPDSRIALTSAAGPEFAAQWEAMARTSFAMYQSYLGMPGSPIEWTDRYSLSDVTHEESTAKMRQMDTHGFAHYNGRIADLTPRPQEIPEGMHPFPTKYVWRSTSLSFNVADYSRQLMNDFLIAGGKIETREFRSPQEVASLPQPVIINCTGYGARQLWSDESIVPVRGQIAWLIPQEGVHYGLYYKDVNVLARRDGIVVQSNTGGEDSGWDDSNEQPNRAEAEADVEVLQELYSRMEKMKSGRAS